MGKDTEAKRTQDGGNKSDHVIDIMLDDKAKADYVRVSRLADHISKHLNDSTDVMVSKPEQPKKKRYNVDQKFG